MRVVINFVKHLRDLRRGFTEADVLSAKKKLSAPSYPGKAIPVTAAEMKAIISMKDDVCAS